MLMLMLDAAHHLFIRLLRQSLFRCQLSVRVLVAAPRKPHKVRIRHKGNYCTAADDAAHPILFRCRPHVT